jgi:uncharacterized protein (DUF2141 family)
MTKRRRSKGAVWHSLPSPIGTYPRTAFSEMLPAMQLKQQSNLSVKPRRRLALFGLSAAIATTTVFAGDLTIEISGITPDRGKVYVAVYDDPETFPISGRQRVGQILAAGDRRLTVHFDLPPGRYAAVAFQDFNGNGILDKNFFGIPKEPYGFSNGAHGSAGPPKFSAAAVTLERDAATSIALK